jgi:WD40 repeat protein
VTCVLFTPDGRRVVSGARDNHVKVCDIAEGGELATFDVGWKIEGMALSPDGLSLIVGGWDQSAQIWDLVTRTLKISLPGESRIQGVAFSHNGRSVATAHQIPDPVVRIWDAVSGRLKHTLRGHIGGVERVAFSPDDRVVASCAGGGDVSVRLWDATSGYIRTEYRGHDDRVWCVAFSPSGRTLASCGQDSRVNLWDLSSGQDRITIPIPGQSIESIVFAPDSTRATLFAKQGPEGTIQALDLSRPELRETARIQSRSDLITGVLSPDGRTLATDATDDLVALWDVSSGIPRGATSAPGIGCRGPEGDQILYGDIAFSRDGRTLAIMKPMSGILELLEIESGVRREFRLPPFQAPGVQFLPGCADIVIYGDGRLILGDPSIGRFRPSLHTGHPWLCPPAFSRDGRQMATGGSDKAIRIWEVSSLEPEPPLLGHEGLVTGLAWSPDEKVLVSHSTGDRTVRFWDIASRQEMGSIDGSPDYRLDLIFSPDGTILAGYGGEPPEVFLWPAPRDEADD